MERNVAIAAKRKKVGEDIQSTRTSLEQTLALRKRLQEEFERIQLQIGPRPRVTEALGQLLRSNRQQLPNVRELRASSKARKEQLDDIRFAVVDTEQQLWPLLDFEATLKSEMNGLAAKVPADQLSGLESHLRELIEVTKSSTEGLRTDLNTYFRELTNLRVQEEQVIALTQQYMSFIDQRVLWIRSIPPAELSGIPDAGLSFRWFFKAECWAELVRHVDRPAFKKDQPSICWLF